MAGCSYLTNLFYVSCSPETEEVFSETTSPAHSLPPNVPNFLDSDDSDIEKA